jgi:hypothetical protein
MDAVKITLERVQSETICYLGQFLNKCVQQAVDDEPVQEKATLCDELQ